MTWFGNIRNKYSNDDKYNNFGTPTKKKKQQQEEEAEAEQQANNQNNDGGLLVVADEEEEEAGSTPKVLSYEDDSNIVHDGTTTTTTTPTSKQDNNESTLTTKKKKTSNKIPTLFSNSTASMHTDIDGDDNNNDNRSSSSPSPSLNNNNNAIEIEDGQDNSNNNKNKNSPPRRTTKILLEDGSVIAMDYDEDGIDTNMKNNKSKKWFGNSKQRTGFLFLSNTKQRVQTQSSRFNTVCCYNKDNGQREYFTKCSRTGLLLWALLATILLLINFAVSIHLMTSSREQGLEFSAATDGTTPTSSSCNGGGGTTTAGGGGGDDGTNDADSTVISNPYDDTDKSYDSSLLCGCSTCVQEIWNKPVGTNAYTCGQRIEYLMMQQKDQYPNQLEACRQISFEFPCDCGSCDPNRCGIVKDEFFVPTNWIPQDDYVTEQTPAPRTDVVPGVFYCYPPEGQRVAYASVWAQGCYIEVKESSETYPLCGPGDNKFLSDNVIVDTTSGVKLQYKNGAASEIRVLLPNNEKFTYGTYRFEIGNIEVRDATGTVLSTELPKEMVFGMFTWDDTEDYASHENYNHEVDIEISRWNCGTNADTQFLVQPPGFPQMSRFFSGTEPGVYDQGNHVYEFTWNPARIDWYSTAGGGQQYTLKTEEALYRGLSDYVQCMPDKGFQTEVRINLWNMLGGQVPVGFAYDDIVEVTITDFAYVPSTLQYVEDGGLCSKHCQCSTASTCEGGICTPFA